MPIHSLKRLCAWLATGAVSLIAIDRVLPLEPALKVAWLWPGGNAAIALPHILPALLPG